MHDDAQDKVVRPKFGAKLSIRSVIDAAEADAKPQQETGPEPQTAEPEAEAQRLSEKTDPLPRPGDPYTRAYARLSVVPVPSIFFLPKRQLPDGFPFSELERITFADPEKPGDGPVLKVRFGGSETTEVVIEGRNLYPLGEAISLQLVHWVRQLPDGKIMQDNGATVITHIDVKEKVEKR